VGPPSRVLLRLLSVAAAGLAGAPALAAADAQAPATGTTSTSAPAAAAPSVPAATTTAPVTAPASAPVVGTTPAASTAPAITTRPARSRTPTRRAAPKVRSQFAQPGPGPLVHPRTTRTSPAHAHKAPALHPPTKLPPAPGQPGAPALLAPGVAPSPQAAALMGQLAPAAAVNATLGFFRIPLFLLPVYQAAGDQYGVPWQVLAAINEVETDYGYDVAVSSAGAEGWMQFMPSTWKLYGTDATASGYADPYNPADAIFAAARYLHAAGAQKDLHGAIFAYNHSTAYVDSVMLRAKLISVYPQAMIDELTSLSVGVPPVQGSDTGQPTAQPAAPAGTAPVAPAATPAASAPASLNAVSPAMRAALAVTLATRTGRLSTASSGSAAPLTPIGSSATPAAPVPGSVAPSPAAAGTSGTARASSAASSTVALHTRGGSDVVAVKDGKVLRTGRSKRLGGYVTLKDAQGDLFTYGHLARVGTRAPAGRVSVPAASAPPAAARPQAGADLHLASGPNPLQVRVSASGAVAALAGSAVVASTAPGASGAQSPAPSWHPAGAQAPAVSGALRMLGYRSLDSRPPAATIPTTGLPSWSTPVASGWLPLRAGQTLWAGSVLGQAPASGVVRFAVRPAGDSQPVDPRPFLAAWRLRHDVLDPASVAPTPTATSATTALAPATGVGTPGATTATSGLLAAAAKATAVGAVASTAISHRTPRAPLRYDLSTWGQDRMFFLSRSRLEREILTDRRVHVYSSGSRDIALHRIDPRVLAVLEYLADSGLHPSVSALQTGHGADGVDISAVKGVPVAGHQGPGSVTDFAIRRLLALPTGFQPQQIVSLMTYPQASNTVSMANHADRIHLGFRPVAASRPAATAQAASAAAAATTPALPNLAALSTPAPPLTAAQWQRLVRHLDANGNPLLVASPTSAAIPTPTAPGTPAANAG
jgi:hypothetical protein